MRKAYGILLIVLGLALATPVVAAEPNDFDKFTVSDRGKPAPDAPFRDAEGRERTLADYRGRVVLVSLWATWCVPCRKEMPTLDALQQKLGGKDFEVLAISQDRAGATKAKAFLDEIGIRHLPFYIDSSMKSARAFGAYGLPTSILYGRDGREIGRMVGDADWASEPALALIRKALAPG